MQYTIGEVAKILNLPTSTLRYYDKEGLLPNVQKSQTGLRIFQEEDLEWLKIINCLKKTGMQIKDIKKFVEYSLEGDSSIEKRLQLLQKQREHVQQQIENYQENLKIINYKCDFYEQAKKLGSTANIKTVPVDSIVSKK